MGSTLKPDANKIRALRIQKGWPQEQLARIADVSPRTIQRVEAGGNASFETLRSIAGAFDLEAYELMQQATQKVQPATIRESCQVQVQPVTMDAPLFSRCLPYFPVLKMTLGSFALVLLAASAIRLSPFFLAYLDPATPIAESNIAIFQDSPSVPPAMEVGQPGTQIADTAASLTGTRNHQRETVSAKDAAQLVPAMAPAIPKRGSDVAEAENRLATESLIDSETKSEGPLSTVPIDLDWHVNLSGLERIARGPMMGLPLEITGAPDARVAVPRTGAGLAELVSRRVAGDSSLVSRSFVRSGKSTAALFTKAGSAIKRAF